MSDTLEIVFWGHACFGLHRDSKPILLIDPFDPVGLGSTPGPPAIPTCYPRLIATHAHADHAAFHTQPSGVRIHPPFQDDNALLRIDGRTVCHDEFGGRLRGGTTHILDIRAGNHRIIHMGDVGERLGASALAWLHNPTPDVLIVPAGGYFTLGADAAAMLAQRVRPQHVIFCHTKEDGLPLPALQSRAVVAQRTRHWPQHRASSLLFSNEQTTAVNSGRLPCVTWLARPDGRAL